MVCKDKQCDKQVSIIIPVYNVDNYLSRCIESVVNQSYANIEIIIVDDGSTDGSACICDCWAMKDSRIIVVHQTNGGLSSARNAGLELAHGDYVMFVDSDDSIDTSMVERLIDRAAVNDVDIVITGVKWVDASGVCVRKDGPIDAECDARTYWDWVYPVSSDKAPLSYTCAVISCGKLYRSNIFANERFDIGRMHEDEYILHRIVARSKRIATLSGCYYSYLQREGSITNRPRNAEQMLDATEALYLRAIYLYNDIDRARCARCLIAAMVHLSQASALSIDEASLARWEELAKGIRKLAWKCYTLGQTWKTSFKLLILMVSPRLYCWLNRLRSPNKH